MSKKKHVSIVVAAFLVLGLLAVPSGASEWELSPSSERAGLADISVQAGVITLTPREKFESIGITISGPDGIVYENKFNEAPIAWYVEDSQGKALPDGRYRFEVRFFSGGSLDNVKEGVENPGQKERSRVVSGSFSIENGVVNTASRSSISERDVAMFRRPSEREVATLREPMDIAGLKAYDDDFFFVQSKIGIGIDDSAITPQSALQIQESSPTGILLEERAGVWGTAIEGQWRIRGTDTNFTIGHDPNDSGNERENIVIEEGAPANQLYMAANGNIGLGTSTPGFSLHVDGGFQIFKIENSGSYVSFTTDSTSTYVHTKSSAGTDSTPFQLIHDAPSGSLRINADGDIGIGSGILLDNTVSVKSQRTDASEQELFTLDGNNDVVFNRGSIIAGYPSHLIFGIGSGKRFEVRNNSNTTIMRVMNDNGRVAFGNFFPSYPLQMASGARVTNGGVWTNASSRALKTDIHPLSATQAIDALDEMEPVLFRYKSDESDQNVGFIAEDVPALIATPDRKGMSAMDVVAVLTAVVQEQRKTIGSLLQRVNELERHLGTVH